MARRRRPGRDNRDQPRNPCEGTLFRVTIVLPAIPEPSAAGGVYPIAAAQQSWIVSCVPCLFSVDDKAHATYGIEPQRMSLTSNLIGVG
jgi:hypothetical protein